MNRSLTLFFLAALVACHTDAGTGPSSGPALSGTVSSQNGPIAHALVVASDSADPAQSDTATTDAAGHYEFASLPPGSRTVGLVLSSLPPACIPPGATNVTVVANGTKTFLITVLCVDVTGSYTGFLKVTAGGTAATFDSVLVSLGAAGLFPDSGGFQLFVNPVLDSSTFQFSGHYAGVGYAASWAEDTVVLHGPVVQTNWPVVMPSITFDGVVTVTPTCTPSGPAVFTVGVDSLAGGHLTSVTGTLDYACTVTITGVGTINGTFHIQLTATKT